MNPYMRAKKSVLATFSFHGILFNLPTRGRGPQELALFEIAVGACAAFAQTKCARSIPAGNWDLMAS